MRKVFLKYFKPEGKIALWLTDMSIAKGQDAESSRAGFEEAIANIEPEVEALWATPPGKKTIPLGVMNADMLFVALVMKQQTGKHPFKVVAFVELIARYIRKQRIRALSFATWPTTLSRQNPTAR